MSKKISLLLLCMLLAGCKQNSSEEGLTVNRGVKLSHAVLSEVEDHAAQLLFKQQLIAKLDFTSELLLPAVKDERIYFADTKGHVLVLDRLTGARINNVSTRYKIRSDVGIGEQYLLMGTNKARLIAFDLEDIKQKKSYQLTSELTTSAVYDKDSSNMYIKTIDGTLQAIDTESGKTVWVHQVTNPSLVLRDAGDPVIHDDYIIVGFANGSLLAIEKETGKIVWQNTVSNAYLDISDLNQMADFIVTPIVDKYSIYAANANGQIVSVGLHRGILNWKQNYFVKDKLLVKEKLFFVDKNSTIVALHKNDGNPYWKQTQLIARDLKGPVEVNDLLVVADNTGYLYLLEKNKGRIVGKVNTKLKEEPTYLFAIDDILYVLSKKGMLLAYKL